MIQLAKASSVKPEPGVECNSAGGLEKSLNGMSKKRCDRKPGDAAGRHERDAEAPGNREDVKARSTEYP